MARSRAKSGQGNSGITLRDANGNVVYDRYGRKKYAPRPAKVGDPFAARKKRRAREAAEAEWAKSRAERESARAHASVSGSVVHRRATGRGG